jgi:hypothetical protein
MIFAREISGPLTSLVKKLDEVTGKNQAAEMGSFVVFCSDAENLEKQLKQLATKEQLKHIVLSIDNPAGPDGYNVAKDADVTVVLYLERKIIANYAFKKAELTAKEIDKILADVPRILPKK